MNVLSLLRIVSSFDVSFFCSTPFRYNFLEGSSVMTTGKMQICQFIAHDMGEID